VKKIDDKPRRHRSISHAVVLLAGFAKQTREHPNTLTVKAVLIPAILA